ncbi:MAG: nucleotidyltransferase family protein [Rhizomicrobium sp.]
MSIAAIILAAGLSTRMGGNKLLEDIGGKPMLRRVAETALASHARPILVVVGNEREAACCVLAGLDLQTVENTAYREGLGASIRAGVAAVPESCEGALILLGDMPRVPMSLIDRIIETWRSVGACAICVAAHCGQRGHPVLFGRPYFPDLLALSGDVGARRVIARNQARVRDVEAGNDAPLADIDTPEALAEFRATLA